MTSASWSMMLMVMVNAILFHAMPRISRPDILFAVTVPEGTPDGAVLRLRGMGAPGARGGTAGDLLLHVQVRPDAEFSRRGDDIYSEVDVPAPIAGHPHRPRIGRQGAHFDLEGP